MDVMTRQREGRQIENYGPWSHELRLEEIKRQIGAGTYLTESRIAGAIDALHRELSVQRALCPASV